MKKVFHLVPILIENSCIVNKKKRQIMTVGEVNSLLVGDLNKFEFMGVFKGYRLFLSYFFYKYILN